MKAHLIMNAHLITARFIGPTDTKGSRVKLTSQRFPNDSHTMSYDYASGNVFNQAKAWLSAQGYTIVAGGDTPGWYWFAVSEFRPLKDSK